MLRKRSRIALAALQHPETVTEALLDAQKLGFKRLRSCFYQKPQEESKRPIVKTRTKSDTDFAKAA